MVTGHLSVPELDIHTIYDQLVPVEPENWYRQRVIQAGSSPFSRQAFVEATGLAAPSSLAPRLPQQFNEQMSNRSPMLSLLALITLTCAILAGCTGAGLSSTNRAATPAPSQSQASGAHRAGPLGTAGNPLVLTCAAEAFPGYPDPPVPSHPRPEDLAIGPLYIANGRMVAAATPAQYGYAPYGRNGRSYKIGLVVTMGSMATVTIAAPARGHVVIDNPSARNLGLGGVTSITYQSCPHAQGFFAQGFAFTHRPTRGCVPLDVTIDNRPPVHHVTLSLFAGRCAR